MKQREVQPLTRPSNSLPVEDCAGRHGVESGVDQLGKAAAQLDATTGPQPGGGLTPDQNRAVTIPYELVDGTAGECLGERQDVLRSGQRDVDGTSEAPRTGDSITVRSHLTIMTVGVGVQIGEEASRGFDL